MFLWWLYHNVALETLVFKNKADILIYLDNFGWQLCTFHILRFRHIRIYRCSRPEFRWDVSVPSRLQFFHENTCTIRLGLTLYNLNLIPVISVAFGAILISYRFIPFFLCQPKLHIVSSRYRQRACCRDISIQMRYFVSSRLQLVREILCRFVTILFNPALIWYRFILVAFRIHLRQLKCHTVSNISIDICFTA